MCLAHQLFSSPSPVIVVHMWGLGHGMVKIFGGSLGAWVLHAATAADAAPEQPTQVGPAC